MGLEKNQRLFTDVLQGSPFDRHHDGGDSGPLSPTDSADIGPVGDQQPDTKGSLRGLGVQQGLEVATSSGSEDRYGNAH
jgi:hypothetical protein